MPRKPQFLTDRFVYHVTARSNNKEFFFLPTSAIWSLMSEQLDEVSIFYAARIISFVLMSNHFHMLIETPLKNLNEIMNYFMRETSRAIGRVSVRINHVFGGRYKSSLISNETYFAHAYKYVYRNPIQARIAGAVEDYPYSTLRWVTGKEPYRFAVYDVSTLLANRVPVKMTDRLTWLNTPYLAQQNTIIQKGLRRVEFSFPRDHNYTKVVRSLLSEKEVGTF